MGCRSTPTTHVSRVTVGRKYPAAGPLLAAAPRRVFLIVDSSTRRCSVEVNAYLARGAGVDPKELVEKEQNNQLCDVAQFLKNLNKGLLKRSTAVVPTPPGGGSGLR